MHVVSATLTLVTNNNPDENPGVTESAEQQEPGSQENKPKLRLIVSSDIPVEQVKRALRGTKANTSVSELASTQTQTPGLLQAGASAIEPEGSAISEPVVTSSEAGLFLEQDDLQGLSERDIPTLMDQVVSSEESVAEVVQEYAAEDLIFAHNELGKMFVSEEYDPFQEQEFVLFKRQVFSCWYDSKDKAIDGLYRLLIDGGINFASSTTIEVKTCYLGDFAYKKYAFKAVVGLYFKETPHHDEKLCATLAHEINEIRLPEAIQATDDCIERLDQYRRAQEFDELRTPLISDTMLVVTGLVCVGLIVTALVSMTVGSGIFG